MSTIGYINIALEIFGGMLSLVFILCVSLTGHKKDRMEQLYICILTCNTVILFCDAIAWICKARLDLFSAYAVRYGNFVVFSFGYILLAIFTEYLVHFIATKDSGISKRPARLMWGLALLAIVLVILSQFNHMYYSIDEQNVYHRQNWFWLSQLFGIFGMIINGGTLFRHRKLLERREIVAFSTYIVMPIAAMLIQMFSYGVAVLYLATTIGILGIYINIQVEQTRRLAEKEVELEKSRTAIMLSQIQPHFLYNTLLGIRQLCDDQPQKAAMALEHFSYYLRGNLGSLSRLDLISFENERNHAENYVYLEKMRFGDRVNVVWDIEFWDFYLPPLTLQPIIENAIRHGITKKEKGGTVEIQVRDEVGGIIIIVKDDGIGFDPSLPEKDGRIHIGVENVRLRLRAQCGGQLHIQSEIDVGTQVKIILPKSGAAIQC